MFARVVIAHLGQLLMWEMHAESVNNACKRASALKISVEGPVLSAWPQMAVERDLPRNVP